MVHLPHVPPWNVVEKMERTNIIHPSTLLASERGEKRKTGNDKHFEKGFTLDSLFVTSNHGIDQSVNFCACACVEKAGFSISTIGVLRKCGQEDDLLTSIYTLCTCAGPNVVECWAPWR